MTAAAPDDDLLAFLRRGLAEPDSSLPLSGSRRGPRDFPPSKAAESEIMEARLGRVAEESVLALPSIGGPALVAPTTASSEPCAVLGAVELSGLGFDSTCRTSTIGSAWRVVSASVGSALRVLTSSAFPSCDSSEGSSSIRGKALPSWLQPQGAAMPAVGTSERLRGGR